MKDYALRPELPQPTLGGIIGPGDIKYVDVNGDGTFSDEDRTIIGNPNPDFMMSLTLNGRYKNFDAEVFVNGVFGNDVINPKSPTT